MKITNQIFFVFIIICISIGCKKETPRNGIIGTWQLVEVNIADAGVSAWEGVVSKKEITFLVEGTYTCTGVFCSLSTSTDIGSSGLWNASDDVLGIENCNQTLTYEIVDGELVVNYDCIEDCSHKYERK